MPQSKRSDSVSSAPSVARLHVAGMDCADEAALIRHALARPGIEGLNFDLVGRRVDVQFNPEKISQQAILDAVAATGLAAHSHDAGEHVGDDHHGHDHHHDTAKMWAIASGGVFAVAWLLPGVGFLAGAWGFWQHAAWAPAGLVASAAASLLLLALPTGALRHAPYGAALAFDALPVIVELGRLSQPLVVVVVSFALEFRQGLRGWKLRRRFDRRRFRRLCERFVGHWLSLAHAELARLLRLRHPPWQSLLDSAYGSDR